MIIVRRIARKPITQNIGSIRYKRDHHLPKVVPRGIRNGRKSSVVDVGMSLRHVRDCYHHFNFRQKLARDFSDLVATTSAATLSPPSSWLLK